MTIENVITLVIQTVFGVAAFFALYIRLIDRINKSNESHAAIITDIKERIVRMEVVWDVFGEKAAKILHRDDDAYGVDALLEKYLDKHYDLSMSEWEELHDAMEKVANNNKIPKSERTLAAWLCALSIHKMGSYWTEKQAKAKPDA